MNTVPWLKSRGHDPFRFYTLANERFLKGYRFSLDHVYERDAENFQCRTALLFVVAPGKCGYLNVLRLFHGGELATQAGFSLLNLMA